MTIFVLVCFGAFRDSEDADPLYHTLLSVGALELEFIRLVHVRSVLLGTVEVFTEK